MAEQFIITPPEPKEQFTITPPERPAKPLPFKPTPQPSFFQRAAGAVGTGLGRAIEATQVPQRAVEAGLSRIGGAQTYEDLYRRAFPGRVGEILGHPWSPSVVIPRAILDPVGIGLGLGGQALAARGARQVDIARQAAGQAELATERALVERGRGMVAAQPELKALPSRVARGPSSIEPIPLPSAAVSRGYVSPGVAIEWQALQRQPRPTPQLFSAQRIVRPDPTPPPATVTDLPTPRQAQQVMFPIGGAAPVKTAWQHQAPKNILNRVLGGGMGDKLAEAEAVEVHLIGPRNVGVRRSGLLQLSDAEDSNLFRVLEGRAQPMNQKVAWHAQAARKMFDDDAAEYTQVGARILRTPHVRHPVTGQVLQVAQWDDFKAIPNYAPRMMDANAVHKMDVTDLANALARANRGMSAQDAADMAVALKAEVAGTTANVNPQILQVVKGQAFLPGHLHARTALTLPSEVLLPMREAIPIYIEQSARERAFLRTFGPRADDDVANLVGQLGPRNHDVALAEQVWDTYRGRFIESATGRRQKASAGILNNLASALLLGPQTALIQFSQFAPLIGKFGVGNVAKGLARVVIGGRQEAEAAGTFVKSLRSELVRVTQAPPTATFLQRAEQATGRLASGVVKWSGIRVMDEFPRAVGYHAAEASLKTVQRAALAGNQKALRALAEVNLTAGASAEELSIKAAELSRRFNVTAGFADLPFVLQTPVGQFARGLQTFNIQASRLVWNDFILPAVQYVRTGGKHGNLDVLRLAASSLIIGEVLGEARRGLIGRRDLRPGGPIEQFVENIQAGKVPTRLVMERARDNFAWAGSLGVVDTMLDALEKGPQRTSEVSGRLALRTIGAGPSQVVEGVAVGQGLARAPFQGEKARREALREAGRFSVRRVPGAGGIAAPLLFPPKKR